VSFSMASIVLTHLSLLGLARLRTSYQWVRLATAAAVILLGSLIFCAVWDLIQSRDNWRLVAVLVVLGICGSILVMSLSRGASIPLHEVIATTSGVLSLTCPRCGRRLQVATGRSNCTQCGLGFSIEIEEAQCHRCGYPRYGLESSVCPECGTPFAHTPASTPE